ncbi:hypothetical protein J6P92_08265 [bacterium]|nr:hypothetical protein [bacterium]
MQIQADYKNSNIYSYKNRIQNKNVSFEGINLRRLFTRSKSHTFPQNTLNEYAANLSSFLNMEYARILPRVQNLDGHQKKFLQRLAVRYSDENFSLAGNLKEDSELVFQVFEQIKAPQDYHYYALSNMTGSFGYVAKVFSLADDKETFEFIDKFRHKILPKSKKSREIVIDILQSPFKKQYISDIDDFRSYFILNSENPDVIKNLDNLLENNQFDRKVFDIRLAVKNILSSGRIKSGQILTQDNIEKYYSKSGADFLEQFIDGYYANRDFKLAPENELNILEMYKSTTKDNIQSRLNVLEKFEHTLTKSENGAEDEIPAMRKLFEMMDTDKHAKKFVDKFTSNGHVQIESIAKLTEILEELTPEKVYIFSNNIFRILRRVEGDELVPVLKEQYNNPFFETKASEFGRKQMERYRYRDSESYLSKQTRRLINKFNEIRYAHSSKKTAKPVQSVDVKPVVTEEMPIRLEHTITDQNGETVIKLVNKVKESPKARKLRLIGEVDEFISKKLSAKTIEEQGIDYRKKATKMRLKMLPEIFASIKETRQADRRLPGNKKPKSSNKDAVELYKLIKGNNRKYIKYLLEKRNVDGTRMFEVKDIISMIEEANKHVESMKKANPEFKAKDAKAYFDHLYDAKVEQYGKVKRPKKK